MRSEEQTAGAKNRMLEALRKTFGIITPAAESAGISIRTHQRWMLDDAEYRKSYEEILNSQIDFAESQLLKQMKEGVPASTIFFLKCKAKHRGYIEKTEVDMNVRRDVDIEKVVAALGGEEAADEILGKI